MRETCIRYPGTHPAAALARVLHILVNSRSHHDWCPRPCHYLSFPTSSPCQRVSEGTQVAKCAKEGADFMAMEKNILQARLRDDYIPLVTFRTSEVD